ncbi:MAG: septum formation initiator family protein [bacterium]|nr:septum formation initiator family protein [bacterium]
MNKLFQSPLLTVPLILIMGFLLLQIIKINPEKSDLDKKVANLEGQISKQEQLLQELEKEADYYQSDSYKERQARIRLNYKKPGEKVILVYDSPVDVEKQASKSEEALPFWRNWLEYLFGE